MKPGTLIPSHAPNANDVPSEASGHAGRQEAEAGKARSADRYRRAGLTAAASAASRLVVIVVSLVSVPLMLSYVGIERFGLWAAVGSVVGMLVFADFGLGNGLVTAIGEVQGTDDATAHRYVSSGFALLGGLAAILGLCFALIYAVVPWAAFFNVSTPAAVQEAGPTMAVFFACFLASLPLGVASRVQLGYQEGYFGAIWTGAGSLLSLVALTLVIRAGGSLPLLVLALSGGPVIGLLGNTLFEFRARRAWLAPNFALADRGAAERLLRLGFLFFVLQLAVAVAYLSDVLVAARMVGPSAAADYTIAYRLFMIVPALLNLGLTPLWPAYAEAIARGDMPWVRHTLRRSTVIAGAGAVIVVGPLLVAARWVLSVWVGPAVTPPDGLLVGMAVWAVLSSTFNSIAMLFNGAAVMRFQVVVASVMAVASVGASVLLASRFGVSGVIWGTVLAYLLFAAIPIVVYLPRLLRSLELRTSNPLGNERAIS